jgi:S1-C subfamily serine protease
VASDAVLEIYRAGVCQTTHGTIQSWPETKPAIGPGPQRKLGLELVSGRRPSGESAMTVGSVDPAGTAADSGIQKDDIILEVQQGPVSDPEQAARLFEARSRAEHRFAAVLVDGAGKPSWIPVAVPD